jgi:phosphatidylethanolamine/phosphatidyl-N-methylethanolamine N-methyltransferase
VVADEKSRPGEGAAELDEKSIVAAYARWAPIYDYLFGVITIKGRRESVGVINALPAGRVLEAGVGTGISLPLYDPKHRVTGIDLSPDMLAKARERVARHKLTNVEAILELDAAHLPMADQSFDAAMAMYLLPVVPDLDRVLSEIVRVTRPGGRLVVVNHFATDRGIRAQVEKLMTPFASRLGWHPDFRIERVLGRGDLRLLEQRPVAPLRLYTLLVFERV